ncbi:hypothetical protein M5362_16975 [Streptomyces sp. Je 1-79]|uniref:hypothetical protein n=1 Tax=Streptomyces sp. Je 1-79 TaxID=2943847 RepID=UPI0021A25DE5|nr:hypothetical protein [Streptomyces sp. Je 1-79]MCT4354825.1 hypothetical protein [Streptomyces sp. Je 1-79]
MSLGLGGAGGRPGRSRPSPAGRPASEREAVGPGASETVAEGAAGADGQEAGEEAEVEGGRAEGGRAGGPEAPGTPGLPLAGTAADGEGEEGGEGGEGDDDGLGGTAFALGPEGAPFDGPAFHAAVAMGAGAGRSDPYATGTAPITSQHTATGPSARHRTTRVRSARVRARRSPGVTG